MEKNVGVAGTAEEDSQLIVLVAFIQDAGGRCIRGKSDRPMVESRVLLPREHPVLPGVTPCCGLPFGREGRGR